jgi:hypothetical protein
MVMTKRGMNEEGKLTNESESEGMDECAVDGTAKECGRWVLDVGR